jgi:hypothetical protein
VKDIESGELFSAGGVFTPVFERREIFEQVRVNPESRTVERPGEVDLDSEVPVAISEQFGSEVVGPLLAQLFAAGARRRTCFAGGKRAC